MKKLFLFGLLFLVSMLCFVSAEEINYTSPGADSSGISVVQLRYEPYPVNPGEYFDVYIKAQNVGSGSVKNIQFELVPEFPFSLDGNEESIRYYGTLYAEPVVLHYKVRVSEDAVEGTNKLGLRYKTGDISSTWVLKEFDIEVADAQTDFDLVVQESTDSEVAIAIANTGKNTANSLIVRIPSQDDFKASGTNGQMVGNLDSGDYSIVSFSLTPVRGEGDGMLTVQMDYTDSIGERRSVLKDVQFNQESASVPSGNFTQGEFNGEFGPRNQGSSAWKWVLLIVVVAAAVVVWIYRKNLFKRFKLKGNKDNSGEPDWVASRKKSR